MMFDVVVVVIVVVVITLCYTCQATEDFLGGTVTPACKARRVVPVFPEMTASKVPLAIRDLMVGLDFRDFPVSRVSSRSLIEYRNTCPIN